MKNLFHAKLRTLKVEVPVHNMKAYGGSSGTVQVQFRHSSGTVQVQFRHSSGTVQVQFRYSSGTVQVQFRHSSGTVQAQFQSFFTLALYGGEWSISRLYLFSRGENASITS